MNLQDYLQWWNVIYLAPLAVSLFWILATVMGGLDAGGGGDTGDIGDAGDIGNAGGDIGQDTDVGADQDADVSNTGDNLDFSHFMAHAFGIGQAPISLILGVFMFCWGVFGMSMNQLWSGLIPIPAVYIWPSMGATLVLSYVITRSMTAILGRYLPNQETYGISREDLVGSTGVAVYSVTSTRGTVDIKDKYGTVHREQAKTYDAQITIPAGSAVLIIEYDSKDHKFVVKSNIELD